MSVSAKINNAVDMDDLDSALELAEAWVKNDQNEHKAWSKLSFVYEVHGNYTNAVCSIKKALSIKNDYPPYYFKLGYNEYKIGNYKEAAEAFSICMTKSTLLNDGYLLNPSKIALAKCCLLSGDLEKASQALSEVPENTGTWLDGRYLAGDIKREIERRIKKAKPGVQI
ncbi:tetratricopeptide repeat protein [Janthinobacterium sp. LM6]|uniref:tetratricopeptide repeat protein n=1 Tax=Janthinobacterium sp. LM6 TaxID=1938606 RepID=UPI00123779E6|nr:hypothetical protein [Janthinobacterium sp. LM6]